MDERNVRIGLFDSGVGGLTVLSACRRMLPQATFFYYGDNGNAPYGSRTCGEISELVDGGVGALLGAEVDAIVLACNTATAVCAERLRGRLNIPVVGMEPAIKPAAERYHDVLVLATPRTAESERLRVLVGKFPQCNITVCALPGLAGAIEAYLTQGEVFSLAEHLPPAKPQAVVLGCTHYAFFRREIGAHYGVPVYDGGEGTARQVKALLGAAVDKEGAKNTKTNKSLHSEWSAGGDRRVNFIGKYAVENRKIYERMFKNA